MKAYEVRRARIQDSQEISKLLNSAYRGEGSKVGWTTEADLVGGERTNPADIQALIEASGSHFILMCDGSGTIIGCVHVKEEDAATVYFGMLAVRPHSQTGGIGKSLINEVVKYCEASGRKRIRITVIHCRDELIAYYNRLGFFPTGKEEAFPLEDLVKVKGIKLLEFVKTI